MFLVAGIIGIAVVAGVLEALASPRRNKGMDGQIEGQKAPEGDRRGTEVKV